MATEDREDRGWQHPGSHVEKIVNLQRNSVSTPTALATSSATTGSQSRVLAARSSTGVRPGATGVAELLKAMDPAATDEAILSRLPPSVACVFRPVTHEGRRIGWQVRMGPMTADDLAVARAIAYPAFERASAQLLKIELARLRMSTKAAHDLEGDLVLRLQVIGEECSHWPPDIVRRALRQYARRETFFPSLAEIADELQRVGRHRRMIAEALGYERRLGSDFTQDGKPD